MPASVTMSTRQSFFHLVMSSLDIPFSTQEQRRTVFSPPLSSTSYPSHIRPDLITSHVEPIRTSPSWHQEDLTMIESSCLSRPPPQSRHEHIRFHGLYKSSEIAALSRGRIGNPPLIHLGSPCSAHVCRRRSEKRRGKQTPGS